jgi:hypothetical protein
VIHRLAGVLPVSSPWWYLLWQWHLCDSLISVAQSHQIANYKTNGHRVLTCRPGFACNLTSDKCFDLCTNRTLGTERTVPRTRTKRTTQQDLWPGRFWNHTYYAQALMYNTVVA